MQYLRRYEDIRKKMTAKTTEQNNKTTRAHRCRKWICSLQKWDSKGQGVVNECVKEVQRYKLSVIK